MNMFVRASDPKEGAEWLRCESVFKTRDEFHTNPYNPSETTTQQWQCHGAGETSRTTNYELQGTGWATRAPVAQTLQTVCQTCLLTMATARTCWYSFYLVEYSYHSVPVRRTTKNVKT